MKVWTPLKNWVPVAQVNTWGQRADTSQLVPKQKLRNENNLAREEFGHFRRLLIS